MLKSQIKVGGLYKAKVSNNVVTVRVDAIREAAARYLGVGKTREGTFYDVTNLSTGRKTTFRSAAKFRDFAKKDGSGKSHSRLGTGYYSDAQERQIADAVDKMDPRDGSGVEGPQDNREEGEQGSDPTPVSASSPRSSTTSATAPTAVTSPTPNGLASRLAGAFQLSEDTAPHLIVEARAGTGKTTTLVEGLRFVMGGSSSLTPSPQQKAVWDEMAKSAGKVRTVGFCAFNKSIATELQRRVPQGVDAMTMHSMGFRAVQKALGRKEPNQYVVQDIVCELLGKDARELRKSDPMVFSATEQLVSLCKMNLVGELVNGTYVVEVEELSDLASHYDVDLNGTRDRVFALVPQVLTRCANPGTKINFDDMIWLPIILGLPVHRYDLLLVDEAQDLNRCQQALAKKAGRRLILCGDPKQAIYGFAGADAESMKRMGRELGADAERFKSEVGEGFVVEPRGCIVLPLTVTRRCGKAIVKEAQRVVPDFEAHESNGEGKVSRARMTSKSHPVLGKDDVAYATMAGEGDMVLCRVNAPLISECFRFLKAGRKANIQGRDIGAGLIRLIEKMKADTVPELVRKLDEYFTAEELKENAKKNPSESRLINLQDRRDCIMCFTDGARFTAEVVSRINQIFTDDKQAAGIRLSSIHKAKGLEAERVFFINNESAPCPHPLAKTGWQKEQESNLWYVAVTRAIKELVYVS